MFGFAPFGMLAIGQLPYVIDPTLVGGRLPLYIPQITLSNGGYYYATYWQGQTLGYPYGGQGG